MKNIILGQFFTKKNYWMQRQVISFMRKYKPQNLLDPFAGEGDLLKACSKYKALKIGYDIDSTLKWEINDSLKTIKSLKNGFILTNPPYLSRVSAKTKKIRHDAFSTSNRPDLYQIALDSMLKSGMPGIAIVPETFINSSYSKEHIYSITILIPNPFENTETPVCIICFDPNKIFKKTFIYKNENKLGTLEDFQNHTSVLLRKNNVTKIRFNDPSGQLALIAYDSSTGNKIHFLKSSNLKYNKPIKHSSRVVTKIFINREVTDEFINNLNIKLEIYRNETFDVLLSPFKGNQNLDINSRRRRLDFKTARNIINSI